ncbi:MAG: glycosyltransferase family 9 protein [Candidatus Zixiibacteriota bacterium]
MHRRVEFFPGDRILVSRTDKLGDLILALPFVESLKLRYPECRIEVVASLYASPVLEQNPKIDGIVRVQNDQLRADNLYRKDLLRRLRSANYRAVVALFPESQICRLFYAAGIPHRFGTAGRFHSIYFNHRLLHSRKANRKHESEYNQDFLKYFRSGQTVTMPKVHLVDKELTHARRILSEIGVDGRFAVVHPGSGGSAEVWPVKRYLELARRLEGTGLPVLLTGSDPERQSIDELSRTADIAVRNLAGKTDLRTLAALLSLASVVVSNSTGPLHLAVAVGTRVVGVYPSRVVMSPVRWGPLGDGHRVIQPRTSNCTCPSHHCRCMESITIEKVAMEVLAVSG